MNNLQFLSQTLLDIIHFQLFVEMVQAMEKVHLLEQHYLKTTQVQTIEGKVILDRKSVV